MPADEVFEEIKHYLQYGQYKPIEDPKKYRITGSKEDENYEGDESETSEDQINAQIRFKVEIFKVLDSQKVYIEFARLSGDPMQFYSLFKTFKKELFELTQE
jgi:hypothetical protein